MSYILDALKRAERERHVAKIPTLHTVHGTPAERRRPQWIWIGAAAALVPAALLVIWFLRPEPAPDLSRSASAPASSSPASSAPTPSGPARLLPQLLGLQHPRPAAVGNRSSASAPRHRIGKPPAPPQARTTPAPRAPPQGRRSRADTRAGRPASPRLRPSIGLSPARPTPSGLPRASQARAASPGAGPLPGHASGDDPRRPSLRAPGAASSASSRWRPSPSRRSRARPSTVEPGKPRVPRAAEWTSREGRRSSSPRQLWQLAPLRRARRLPRAKRATGAGIQDLTSAGTGGPAEDRAPVPGLFRRFRRSVSSSSTTRSTSRVS